MIGEKSSVESLKKLADRDAGNQCCVFWSFILSCSEHLRLTLRSNNEPVVFYLSSLFLASVQRHLQSYESPELTVELIAEVVWHLFWYCTPCPLTNHFRHPSGLKVLVTVE